MILYQRIYDIQPYVFHFGKTVLYLPSQILFFPRTSWSLLSTLLCLFYPSHSHLWTVWILVLMFWYQSFLSIVWFLQTWYLLSTYHSYYFIFKLIFLSSYPFLFLVSFLHILSYCRKRLLRDHLHVAVYLYFLIVTYYPEYHLLLRKVLCLHLPFVVGLVGYSYFQIGQYGFILYSGLTDNQSLNSWTSYLL